MAETNPSEPIFEINQIYVKDLSFEAPNSPRIFTRDYKSVNQLMPGTVDFFGVDYPAYRILLI